MKRRKKPKPIPNAEELARSLGTETRNVGGKMKVTLTTTTDEWVARKVREGEERGRTIGRLEAMMDTFALPWNESVRINIAPSERLLLIPILRAEIERLRAKP